MAVSRDEEVLGLEVAVDDPFLVSGGEALGDLEGVVDGLRLGERTGVELLAQRLPFEKLHHEDVTRGGGSGRGGRAEDFFEGMDEGDVRVVKARERARLSLESLTPVFTCEGLLGQDLDRDVSAEARVLRPVHLAHPARAERGRGFHKDRVGLPR